MSFNDGHGKGTLPKSNSLIGCLAGFVLNKAESVTQLVLCGGLSEHVVKRPSFNSSEDMFFAAVFLLHREKDDKRIRKDERGWEQVDFTGHEIWGNVGRINRKN